MAVVTDAAVALAGSAAVVDLDDPEQATLHSAAAVATMLDGPPDAVIGTDGPSLVVATGLARGFGVVGSPPEAVAAAGDKLAQRPAADAAGVTQPEWCRGDGPVADLVDGGPVVVKAVDRSGGQGIIRADNRTEVAAALRRVRRIVGADAPIIVERFVAGDELAVDGLLVDGELRPIAVFDKPGEPVGSVFPETILVRPARVPAPVRERVLGVVAQAANAIGLTDGPVHAEVIVAPDGTVEFVELAARSIGGLCGRIIQPAGRSLEGVIIAAALGWDVPEDLEDRDGAAGVFMLPVPGSGVLSSVTGEDAASTVEGITGVDITIPVGARVVALPEGDRYLGFVFAEGPDADAVESSLRTAVGHLRLEVESAPDRGWSA